MKVGDKVVVYRRVYKQKNWDNTWISLMDRDIGKVTSITEICNTGVSIKDSIFEFPPASLKYAK